MTTKPIDAPAVPPTEQSDASWSEPTSGISLRWGSYGVRYPLGVGLLALAGLGVFWRAWYLALLGWGAPIFPAFLGRMLAGQPIDFAFSVAQVAVLIVVGALIIPTRHGRRWLAVGVLLVVHLWYVLVEYFAFETLAPVLFAVLVVLAWLILRDRSGPAYAIGLPVAAVAAFVLDWLLRNAPLPEVGRVHGWVYLVGAPVLAVVGAAWLVRALEPRFGARRDVARTSAQAQRAQAGASSEAAVIAAEAEAIAAQVRTMAALQEAWDKEHPGQPMPAIAIAPQAAAPTGPGNNVLAVLALVFGLMGGGAVAIVLGHMARAQIRRTGESGDGMAIAGLVLGYIGLAVLVAYLVLVAGVLASIG